MCLNTALVFLQSGGKNKGANIYGVEHNKQWYDKVDGKKLGNIILENDVERYPKIVSCYSL